MSRILQRKYIIIILHQQVNALTRKSACERKYLENNAPLNDRTHTVTGPPAIRSVQNSELVDLNKYILQSWAEKIRAHIRISAFPPYCYCKRVMRANPFPSVLFWKGIRAYIRNQHSLSLFFRKGDTNPSLPFNNILKGEYDLHFPSSVILKGGYEPISSFQYYSETEMSAYIFPSILFWKGDTSLHQKSSIPLNCYSESGVRAYTVPSVLSWKMSGQQQQSFPKFPVLLFVVVVTGVSLYRTLGTVMNGQVTLRFRNPRPGPQQKPTEALKRPSEALQRPSGAMKRPSEALKRPSEAGGGKEEATLEDQLKMKPKVVLFWTSWFGGPWSAKKGVLTR